MRKHEEDKQIGVMKFCCKNMGIHTIKIYFPLYWKYGKVCERKELLSEKEEGGIIYIYGNVKEQIQFKNLVLNLHN